MQRGVERPLIPQPANESSGSLRLGGVQLWQQVLREDEHHHHHHVKRQSGGMNNDQMFLNVCVCVCEASYQVLRHGSVAGNSQDL